MGRQFLKEFAGQHIPALGSFVPHHPIKQKINSSSVMNAKKGGIALGRFGNGGSGFGKEHMGRQSPDKRQFPGYFRIRQREVHPVSRIGIPLPYREYCYILL